VTVIDGARREAIATVKVGRLPQAVAVDAKKNRVYVANSHSDTVTVTALRAIDGGARGMLPIQRCEN